MKHKSKIVLGTVGFAAVFLMASSLPHHLPAKAPVEPRSRPVCDLKREVREIRFPTWQAGCATDFPATDAERSITADTAINPPCAQDISKTEPAAGTIPQAVPSVAPARQEQKAKDKTSSPKATAPQMGDTRMVDGQKQVYFLGFGWIEDNGGGGGGTVVDGDGDINKMVGSMG
jgi:hypothetical protein